MSDAGSTALSIAETRVHEAEKHVAYFRNFVAELKRDGMYAVQAEDLLRQLEEGLDEHREHLAALRAAAFEDIQSAPAADHGPQSAPGP
ncbi:MAG: hypothetical protein JO208_15910 [Alphaproteobacteria bacterium]|nr:hypothetical protein [Alphaproteobacteria bacterium]